jgi:hypothetical protein
MNHRHLTVVAGSSSESETVGKSCRGSQSLSCRMGECWRLFRWFLRGGAPLRTIMRRCVLRSRYPRALVAPVSSNVVPHTDKKAASAK